MADSAGIRGIIHRFSGNPRQAFMTTFVPSISVRTLLLALVATLLGACNRVESTKKPLGDASVTHAYWSAIQEPLPEYDGSRVLQLVSDVNLDPASRHYIISCMQGCAVLITAQCDRIAKLPVHRVDPDAAAYGVEFVKLRLECVSLLESLAQRATNPTGLPDGNTLLLDFLVSLGRRAHDQDGALLGAFKDQAVARSNDVGQAMDRAQTLEQRAAELQIRMTSLKVMEMAVRVKLTERYDREFPAYEARNGPSLTVAPDPRGSPRGPDEIRRDLIGRSLGPAWSFDSLSEFRTLNITGSVTSGNLAVVVILTSVKGQISGREYQFRLRLIYQRGQGGWQLAVVEQMPA